MAGLRDYTMTFPTPFKFAYWTVQPDELVISDGLTLYRLDSAVMAVLCRLAFRSESEGTDCGLVTRTELLAEVWPRAEICNQLLTRAISQLRGILGDDPKHPRFIETVPRRGYRLLVPVVTELGEIDRPITGHTIAVLPIADYSAEPVPHFALGLTELLIAELARHPKLRVISRTSVLRYSDSPLSLAEIADELKVQFIVEASTDRRGNISTSTIQLIDAKTDHHLWVEQFSSEMGELQGGLAKIAAQIVGAIVSLVDPGDTAPINPEARTTRPTRPEALDAYLRGRQLWGLRSLDGFLQAIDAFSIALRLDPNHVPSWCGISDTYATMALYELEAPQNVFPAAMEASRRAIQIDANSPDVLRGIAAIQMLWQWKWVEAEANLRRVVDLEPSDAMAHLALANLLSWTGRADESVVQIEKARRLDPFNAGMNMNAADMLFGAGRFEAALLQYERTLVMAPHLPILYLRMAKACRALEEIEHGLEVLDRGAVVSQNQIFFLLERAAYAAASGDAATAQQLIEDRIKCRDHHVASIEVAAVHALLGRNDNAFSWLETAIEERSPAILLLHVNPDFSNLKSDSRWQSLRDRVGFGPLTSRDHVITEFDTEAPDTLLSGTEVGALDAENSLDALVASGSPMTAPTIRHLLERFRQQSPEVIEALSQESIIGLSEREKEVLNLVARGCSFSDIAELLHVSKHTVRTHVRRIYRKLEVHSKNEAVYEAVSLGLIDMD